MSERISSATATSNTRIQSTLWGAVVSAAVLALSGCGSAAPSASKVTLASTASVPHSQPSRLVLGSPQPGLQFVVPKVQAAEAGPAPANAVNIPVTRVAAGPTTASAAAQAFGNALVADDVNTAFVLLVGDEQIRAQSVAHFRDQLARETPWTSAKVEISIAGAADTATTPTGRSFVTLRVGQTPGIDEIHGVVAPSALVRLPVRESGGEWRVQWERRQVTQEFAADEERLRADVIQWVADRQRSCSATKPSSEYAGGIVGIVGLANALCTEKGSAVVASVGDIYALDDPQPLIDSFGSGSYDWARVVSLSAPAPMNVIAAPVGDRWLVVGVASLRQSVA